MNWSVFFKRLLSSIVYAAIMIGGLLLPDPFAIIILALLIQFLCLREYLTLMERIMPGLKFNALFRGSIQVLGVITVVGMMLFQSQLIFILILIPLIIIFATALRKQGQLLGGLVALTGLLYVSLPMAALIILRQIHFALPLALVLMIWMNDTMAYLCGSFFGKTPFSDISPNKTIEGSAGGALLTFIGAGIWAYYSPLKEIFPFYVWIGLAIVAVIIGSLGDLLESKLKRMAGVKDSGHLMPGHGGALDRFDSLLAALPFALVLVVALG